MGYNLGDWLGDMLRSAGGAITGRQVVSKEEAKRAGRPELTGISPEEFQFIMKTEAERPQKESILKKRESDIILAEERLGLATKKFEWQQRTAQEKALQIADILKNPEKIQQRLKDIETQIGADKGLILQAINPTMYNELVGERIILQSVRGMPAAKTIGVAEEQEEKKKVEEEKKKVTPKKKDRLGLGLK